MSFLLTTPFATLVVASGVILMTGLVLFVASRKRRKGDASHCRKCDYELPAGERFCNECGHTHARNAPRTGDRTPSRLGTLAGVLVILFALVPAGFGVVRAQSVNFYQYAPTSVVISGAEQGSDDAFLELRARIAGGGVTGSNADALARACARLVRHHWPAGSSYPSHDARRWALLYTELQSSHPLQASQHEAFFEAVLHAGVALSSPIQPFIYRPVGPATVEIGSQVSPTLDYETAIDQSVQPIQAGQAQSGSAPRSFPTMAPGGQAPAWAAGPALTPQTPGPPMMQSPAWYLRIDVTAIRLNGQPNPGHPVAARHTAPSRRYPLGDPVAGAPTFASAFNRDVGLTHIDTTRWHFAGVTAGAHTLEHDVRYTVYDGDGPGASVLCTFDRTHRSSVRLTSIPIDYEARLLDDLDIACAHWSSAALTLAPSELRFAAPMSLDDPVYIRHTVDIARSDPYTAYAAGVFTATRPEKDSLEARSGGYFGAGRTNIYRVHSLVFEPGETVDLHLIPTVGVGADREQGRILAHGVRYEGLPVVEHDHGGPPPAPARIVLIDRLGRNVEELPIDPDVWETTR